jgi:hypothetical protein
MLLLVTLPSDSPSAIAFTGHFLAIVAVQGLVMMVQNHYHKHRMYARVAVGKSGAMDVVSGESSGAQGQLWVLYPLLFAFQLFQGYVGLSVLRVTRRSVFNVYLGYLDTEDHTSDLRGQRTLFYFGLILVFLALGNFYNTMRTILGKRAFAAKAKSKSYLNVQRASVDALTKRASPAAL